MFLTEYFTSVRVPDSATCHPRTPSSTPSLIPLSPHPLSLTLLGGLPRGNLNPCSSRRGPSWWSPIATQPYILLRATARWLAQSLGHVNHSQCAETIPGRCREPADKLYRWREDLFRNTRDLINNGMSSLPPLKQNMMHNTQSNAKA